ncbi:MAG: hypothetical protein IPJ88_11075 [Myxococcales bacterium]|nr:MAG: hypothetical protein IPJ88_11075 [Myxococcales bacterium]
MATNQSPPKTQLIFLYVVLSVLVLVALKPVLDSYYSSMTTAELTEKVSNRPAVELKAVKTAQAQVIAKATMPVSRAKRLLLRDGRNIPAIMPNESSDSRAMVGWLQFGGHVPNPVMEPAASEVLAEKNPPVIEEASSQDPLPVPEQKQSVTKPQPALPKAAPKAVPKADTAANPAADTASPAPESVQ